MKRPYTAVGEIMGRIERAVRARLQDVGYLPDQHPARMLPIELLPVIMGDTTAETLQAWMQVERSATQTPLAEGLAFERNMFMALCSGEPALERMRNFLKSQASATASGSR